MPSGQPMPSASCQLHPLRVTRQHAERGGQRQRPAADGTGPAERLRNGVTAAKPALCHNVANGPAREVSRWRLLLGYRILRSVDHAAHPGDETPACRVGRPPGRPSRGVTRRVRHTGAPCVDCWRSWLPRPGATAAPRPIDAIAGASHLMRHRGPDEPGTWADPDADGEAPCSASTGCPSSTSRIRTSRCAGGRRRRPTATCWCSTARSTTTSNCATNWPPRTARCSPPTATARPSSPATTTGAPTC